MKATSDKCSRELRHRLIDRFYFAMPISRGMLLGKKMETEKAQKDVVMLEATLDELLLALRKLNARRGPKKAEILRFNRETRLLLEQIHSSLNAT